MSREHEDEKYFIDFIPNHLKKGITVHAEKSLKDRFERRFQSSIVRWGELPAQTIRVKQFELLYRQARHLYIDGYLEATVSLCGMTVEALCISIAEERVPEGPLKEKLISPKEWVSHKVTSLKKYFKGNHSASLLWDVLEIRRECMHLHRTQIKKIDALECVKKLHLVLLAEYGLVTGQGGRFYSATPENVEDQAKQMGISLE